MPLRKSIIWSYSGIKMCSNLCSPKDCSMPGFPVFHYLPEFAQAHVHLVIDAIKPYHLCHSLFLLTSVFPSIRVLSSELTLCITWLKYWRFSFSISPSNEYSGLISLRIDWFDLLAAQGTLRSLFQHHNLKASILQPLLYAPIHEMWICTWLLEKP